MELALISAGLALLETLIPKIGQLFTSGQITAEEQAAVRARYLALRGLGDAAFTGPEWDVSTAPQAPGTTVTTTTVKTTKV